MLNPTKCEVNLPSHKVVFDRHGHNESHDSHDSIKSTPKFLIGHRRSDAKTASLMVAHIPDAGDDRTEMLGCCPGLLVTARLQEWIARL